MKKLALALAAILLLSTCSAFADVLLEGEKVWDGDTPFEFTLMIDDSYEPDGRVAYEMLEKKTNVHVKLNLAPYQVQLEKMAVALSTGDYADVIAGWLLGTKDVIELGGDGTFLALEDYIAKYCPHIEEVLNRPGVRESMTLPDGHIYTIPYAIGEPEVTFKPYINQVWLERLGLEMPTTPEELKEVLIAFRDNDANGNGDPNDEIPLAGDYKDGWYTNVENPIMNAFCYYTLDLDTGSTTSSDAFGMYMDGDTVCTPFELEAFRDGVKYVRKLVEEDLLYVGSFTQDLAALTQIAESDRLGACSGGYILFCNLGSDIYRNYRRVLPVAGPDGYTNAISYPYGNVGGNGYTISAKCQYPVEAFKLGDLLYSYAATMRGYYGVYGEQWTDADPGAIGINGEPAMYKLLVPWQESEPQSYCVLQMTISYRDAKFRLGEPSDPNIDLYSGAGLETLLYQVTKEYKPYTKDEKAIPSLKFTDEQNETMSVLKANLSATIKEGMISFFNGTKSIDDEYDAWLATLESQGLPQLVEIYQNAYNAQYK
mgnify:CR=1 FL=1